MNIKIKKIILVMTCIALSVNLVACNKDKQKNEKGLKAITVMLDWTPNTNHTGIYVALAKGYFEDAGFDVKIVQPSEDGAEMAVANKQAEYGISFQDSIAPLYALENKVNVTAVAALVQHNTSGVVSLKEKGIDSFKKMSGMTYATWDMDVEKAIIKNVVETDGGDYGDVKMVPSTVTDVVASFKTDSVDSVWIFYAWDGIALEKAGLETNMLYFKDVNSVFDYYSPILIGNTEYLEENEDEAKAFLEACKKGYEYAIKEPDDASKILVKQVPELDEEMVIKSQKWLVDQYKAEVEVWGQIDAGRWNGFYKWLYENKLIENEIPTDYGFTNAYLK